MKTIKNKPEHSISLQNLVLEFFKKQRKYRFQLGPLNLWLFIWDIIFIVGGNGSENFSAEIDMGLYQPSSGNIMVDAKK